MLQTLQQQGLRHVVLCPGSRSGPLALAAAGLQHAGLITLSTAIDERSAGFHALGRSSASGVATAVITTSGTAVANLLPAAVEADRSNQPLLLISADRPLRLKNKGANQTVNQEAFLTPVCRWCGSGPLDGVSNGLDHELRALAETAWRHLHQQPGPVHLNCPFEEPLLPDLPQQKAFWTQWNSSEALAADAANPELWTPTPQIAAPSLDPDQPGVIVAGPWRGLSPHLEAYQAALIAWQQRSGWPVLADPLAAIPSGLGGVIRHWDLLLPNGLSQLPSHAQVLRLGSVPASRRLEAWLASQKGPQLLITEGDPRPLDPLEVAQQWSGGMARWWQELSPQLTPQLSPQLSTKPNAVEPTLIQAWSKADRDLQQRLSQLLPASGAANEPALMLALAQLLPAQLPVMLAASSPVRDWQAFAAGDTGRRRCYSFRGASGIDGTLSLALGLAAELGPTLLITGDLALLHDSNGWLLASAAQLPLCVLLIDNAGGGIFEQLPIETPSSDGLNQLFAMPQQVDPLALAAAHSIPGRQLACLDDLPTALEWGLDRTGPALLRVCTDRSSDAQRRLDLREALQQSISLS